MNTHAAFSIYAFSIQCADLINSVFMRLRIIGRPVRIRIFLFPTGPGLQPEVLVQVDCFCYVERDWLEFSQCLDAFPVFKSGGPQESEFGYKLTQELRSRMSTVSRNLLPDFMPFRGTRYV